LEESHEQDKYQENCFERFTFGMHGADIVFCDNFAYKPVVSVYSKLILGFNSND